MKDKHTPGPWVYGPEFSAVVTRDKQGTVAILLPLGHTRDDEDIDTEMMDAHGRLIAAAPELLDMVQRLSDSLTRTNDDDQRLYLEAKELIAKLTAE